MPSDSRGEEEGQRDDDEDEDEEEGDNAEEDGGSEASDSAAGLDDDPPPLIEAEDPPSRICAFGGGFMGRADGSGRNGKNCERHTSRDLHPVARALNVWRSLPLSSKTTRDKYLGRTSRPRA